MDAERALRRRGVVAAAELAQTATPDLIGAWCAYAERHPTMGAGALVTAIRSGVHPPTRRGRESRSTERDVRAWIERELPDVCAPDPPAAAVRCVLALWMRHGRRRVSAARHGSVIRAAILADQEARP